MKQSIPTPEMSSFIWEDLMKPLNLSVTQLAHEINIPEAELQAVLNNKEKVSADLSTKLGKYFKLSETYFFNIQKELDKRNAKIS